MRGEKIRPQPKPTKAPKASTTRRPARPGSPQPLTRRACWEAVWARAGERCERCGRKVSRDCWPGDVKRAHVNERVPRSRGGDPRDPSNCELLCQGCHLPHGIHMPTLARQRRALERIDFFGTSR